MIRKKRLTPCCFPIFFERSLCGVRRIAINTSIAPQVPESTPIAYQFHVLINLPLGASVRI
jgi:hypothetical protein